MTDVDDGMETYNYNNANDVENFCPCPEVNIAFSVLYALLQPIPHQFLLKGFLHSTLFPRLVKNRAFYWYKIYAGVGLV